MSKKPQKETLKSRLLRAREIELTVTGRKSGRRVTIPVWFVLEEEKLYLVPVSGSDTQWYKNVLKNPSIQVEAGGQKAELKAAAITDAKNVSPVVDKFREKYGAGDIKKYYSKLDVAVVAEIT